MSKFRKVAAIPAKLPGNAGMEGLFSQFMDAKDMDEFLNKKNISRNLQFIAALFPGFTDRYSPSAFYHALEYDKDRGYNNTSHSQGAHELLDPKIMEEVKKFKKNPPKDLKDVDGKPIKSLENINLPETSGRYKAMEEQLYPEEKKEAQNTNSKFVKTSQVSKAKELERIVPKWTIEDVIKDMARVAKRSDLSQVDKQQTMINILSNYEKSIAPLSNFLNKNGIQYK